MGEEARATMAPGMQVTPSVHLLSPIGVGGMGSVWLAQDKSLNRQVVVKFMLGGFDASPAARKRFEREATAAAGVKSPHVVETYEHGVTDGIPFIVMEHLEGRDLGGVLADRLKEGRAFEREEVVTIVTQVAKALGKAHTKGLLHRDVKPDNIFLCDNDEGEIFVKLLDFGIAKSSTEQRDGTLDGETKTGQVVGTPFYMSPEQVTAQKVIDARADLWALGVVTFELLTGQRPFDGPSFGALAVKIATGDPLKPSEVRPEIGESFDKWFAKACARDPKDRFASARAMADALREAFGFGVASTSGGGVHSDSGRRALSSSSGSRSAPSPDPSAPGLGDSQPRDPSPSFGLASTINEVATPNPSAMGKSAPRTTETSKAPTSVGRGPRWIALAGGAIALFGGAFFVVRMARDNIAGAASHAGASLDSPGSAVAASTPARPPTVEPVSTPSATTTPVPPQAGPTVAVAHDAGAVRPVLARPGPVNLPSAKPQVNVKPAMPAAMTSEPPPKPSSNLAPVY